MRYDTLVLLLLASFLVGCGGAGNDNQSNGAMTKETEFEAFLRLFPDLELPMNLGGEDLNDPGAFPRGVKLGKEGEAGRLYEGEDPLTEFFVLGRIYRERELMHLVVLKEHPEFKEYMLLIYDGGGKVVQEVGIARTDLNGEYVRALVHPGGCMKQEGILFSVSEEGEMEEVEEKSLMLIELHGAIDVEEAPPFDCF